MSQAPSQTGRGATVRAGLTWVGLTWSGLTWSGLVCLGLVGAMLGCRAADDVSGDPSPTSGTASGEAPSGSVASTQLLEVASWTEQLQAVRSGESREIHVPAALVTAEELSELSETAAGESLVLENLLLDGGRVADADLQYIARVHSLEHLRLRESPISDAGIQQLCQPPLPNLRVLNLPQAKLTAEGIRQLASLPRLSQLRLGGQHLDDHAVAALAALPELRSLHLIGPRLTDAALDELAKAPKLSSFYLDDCQLSDDAWERLFAAKPKLHVHIDQLHHDRDPLRHENP